MEYAPKELQEIVKKIVHATGVDFGEALDEVLDYTENFMDKYAYYLADEEEKFLGEYLHKDQYAFLIFTPKKM